MCACIGACVRARVCVCVCVVGWFRVCRRESQVYVRACVHACVFVRWVMFLSPSKGFAGEGSGEGEGVNKATATLGKAARSVAPPPCVRACVRVWVSGWVGGCVRARA